MIADLGEKNGYTYNLLTQSSILLRDYKSAIDEARLADGIEGSASSRGLLAHTKYLLEHKSEDLEALQGAFDTSGDTVLARYLMFHYNELGDTLAAKRVLVRVREVSDSDVQWKIALAYWASNLGEPVDILGLLSDPDIGELADGALLRLHLLEKNGSRDALEKELDRAAIRHPLNQYIQRKRVKSLFARKKYLRGILSFFSFLVRSIRFLR
ncbi:hypothetical protein [Fimbriimonas ginsengisoli]|uniref:hypothetical protein n=1 Tax=Fimbriimonas ginsengisoli TaxID=1005039 RepID=UPI001186921A|nr:hypothetical protein [Fimbriimonas ginsengisoli]